MSSFDPAMADIQAALESSIGNIIAGNSSSNANHDDGHVLIGRVLFVGGNDAPANPNPTQSSLKSQTPASLHSSSSSTGMSHRWPPCESQPLYLYFNIDKQRVFQVDARQVITTELVATTNDHLPPCLVIVFSCCTFRIFPLYTPSPTKPTSDSDTPKSQPWKQEALQALQVLDNSLHRLAVLHSTSSRFSAAWSPSTTSLLSSSDEAGQGNGTFFPLDGHSHGHSHSHSSTNTGSMSSPHSHSQAKKLKRVPGNHHHQVSEQQDPVMQKIRHKVQALSRCHAGLQALEYVLEASATAATADMLHPPPTGHDDDDDHGGNDSASSSNAAAAMPKTQLQHHPFHPNNNKPTTTRHSLIPLLAGITEDLTNAHVNHAEQQQVLQQRRRDIEDLRNQPMEDLLDAFFPNMPYHPLGSNSNSSSSSTSKNKKNRPTRNNNGSLPNNNNNNVASDNRDGNHKKRPAKEVMESVKLLMKKQMSLVKERNSILALPTRG